MFSLPKKSKARLILYSPTLAVVAAYLLRIFLLWLSQHKDGAVPTLPVTGLEAGRVALSIAKGKGFFGPFPGYEAPTAWLAPGYPLLWAICIRLTRFHSGTYILLAQFLNSAFSAATCWPIFSIGKKLFGEKVGLASAWVWVFLPSSILMSLEWTWDQCVTAFLFALIIDVTLRLRDSTSPLAWSGYGLLWAAGALVNPAMCALLPFLLGWLMFQRWKAGLISPALYARAVLLFFLAVLPWSIRNYYVVDGWFFVKSNFGLELWIGNHPASYTRETHPMFSLAERMALILEGEANYSRGKERLALAYIEAHPGEFLRNCWGRMVDTWAGRDEPFSESWIKVLDLGREDFWLSLVFSGIAFAGLLLSLGEKWAESLPLLLCPIIFPIPYYITHTSLRYRHPIDPFIAILAVYTVSRLFRLGGVMVQPEPIEDLEVSTAD